MKTARSQQGAALVTVLMIVAAMAVVAMGLSQLVFASTQRAKILDQQAQMRMYAVAAEEIAKIQLAERLRPLQGAITAETPGFSQPLTIPVDGGVFVVSARDASSCFDLNRLVTGAVRTGLEGAPDAEEELKAILNAAEYDFDDPDNMVTALVDWMDSDQIAQLGGAEDSYYSSFSPAFRTSGMPIEDISELLMIRGYDRGAVQAISRLSCALPKLDDTPPVPLNINTLTPDEAVLLLPIFSDAITPDEAEGLILDRPAGGWADLEAFLQEPVVAKVAPDQRRIERLGVVTSFIEVDADLVYRDQQMIYRYLFAVQPNGAISIIRRSRIG